MPVNTLRTKGNLTVPIVKLSSLYRGLDACTFWRVYKYAALNFVIIFILRDLELSNFVLS